LLEAVSKQAHLGHLWCRDADYWAEQVRPELDVDDAETVGGLLEDAAGSTPAGWRLITNPAARTLSTNSPPNKHSTPITTAICLLPGRG
jgi:hypothetical protein